MKVKTNKSEQKFQPIELTITIESQRELEFLWALFNTNDNDLRDMANAHRDIIKEFTDVPIDTRSIWYAVGGSNLNK